MVQWEEEGRGREGAVICIAALLLYIRWRQQELAVCPADVLVYGCVGVWRRTYFTQVCLHVCFACLLFVYSKVRVEGDGIFVKAETSKLAQFRQTMNMCKGQSAEDPRTFLVIGGGTDRTNQSHYSAKLPLS